LALALIHSSTLASLSREHTTEGVRVGVRVRVEGRESHEQDKDRGTREGEWQMEAQEAMTPVAAGAAKRLN
jgi:hypothetical protein